MWQTLRNLGHLLAAFTTNCRRFHHRWNRLAQSTTTGSPGIEGRWEGTWNSDATGHHGRLRCVIDAVDETTCRASFHARYAGLFRACYHVGLFWEQKGDVVHLMGMTNLGRLAGGEYKYKGTCVNNEIHCTYQCRYDYGSFYLKRLTGS